MAKAKPTTPILVKVSRVNKPQSSVAQEIDRIATETGETVQSVGYKAICLGLSEAGKILKQFQRENSDDHRT